MKKNNKELRILSLLLAVLFVYGFYVLLLTPLREKSKALDAEIETRDTVLRGVYSTAANYGANISRLRENCDAAAAEAEGFYVGSEQEQYLEELQKMVTDCHLTFLEMSASNHVRTYLESGTYDAVNPYTVYLGEGETDSLQTKNSLSRAISELAESDTAIPAVMQMDMTLELMGSYRDTQTFLHRLENHDKFILCSALTVDRLADSPGADPTNEQVSLTVELTYLRLEQLTSLTEAMQIPENLPAYTIPQDFMTGAYRNLYSVKNIRTAVESLFHGVRAG